MLKEIPPFLANTVPNLGLGESINIHAPSCELGLQIEFVPSELDDKFLIGIVKNLRAEDGAD